MLNRSLTTLSVAALALALVSCGGGSQESAKIEEGENLSKNPLGAISQLAKAGSDLEKVQKELEQMKPVDPLPFNDLIAFLPEPPAGWQADKPRGESSQMGEWKFSQASRQYSAGDQSMTIEIMDWAYHSGLYAPFFLTAGFSQESTEGYNKGIKIGEDPGREEYQHEAKNGTLSLLVGKRFLLSIKGSGVAAPELRQWLDRVNTAGLRAKAN